MTHSSDFFPPTPSAIPAASDSWPSSPSSTNPLSSSARQRRVFAIGDIHGCARELEDLLKKIKPTKDDLCVFLGDYVDRGPESKQVIDLVLELRERVETIALKGNHEEMFLDFLERPESPEASGFILNGGVHTLASYARADGSIEVPEAHRRFLKSLRLFHATETHFFVHAGVPEIPLERIDEAAHARDLLWIRKPFLSSSFSWGKMIVHGHTPVDRPDIRANRLNLDTACVYGGSLTALELPKHVFHQAGYRGKRPPLQARRGLLRGLLRRTEARALPRFRGRVPVEIEVANRGRVPFLTLNYNPQGILVHDLEPGHEAWLRRDQLVEGRIGTGGKWISFAGRVVRCETFGDLNTYAILIGEIETEPELEE